MELKPRPIREQQRNHRITFRSGGENGMDHYGIIAAPPVVTLVNDTIRQKENGVARSTK